MDIKGKFINFLEDSRSKILSPPVEQLDAGGGDGIILPTQEFIQNIYLPTYLPALILNFRGLKFFSDLKMVVEGPPRVP